MTQTAAQANLAVQGGTEAQREAVATAHASALALAQQGGAAAQAGRGPFATWFGAATASAQATVAAAFGAAARLLQTQWIAYELGDAALERQAYPEIWVLFEPRSATTTDAHLVVPFWDAYALDPATAAAQLAASVLHEALVVSSGGQVVDVYGAIEAGGAQQLASTDAAAALRSARSYMGYATAVVGGAQATAPSAPTAGSAGAAPAEPWHALGIPHARVGVVPQRARVVRFGPDGVGVRQTVRCDFANVRRGDAGEIAGGTFALTTRSADGVRGDTVVALAPGGHPQTARTVRYGRGGRAVDAIVDTDYRGLVLGPGGPLVGGTLKSVTRGAAGAPRSATAQRFDALGNVALASTVRYGARGAVARRALIDFRGATFDADHRVARGVVGTTVRRPDGSVLTRTATCFAQGALALTSVRSYAADGATLQRQLVVLAPRAPGGAATVVRVEHAAGGIVRTRVSSGGRPLLEMLAQPGPDGTTARTAKTFGPDGRTVTAETIDRLAADGTLQTRLTARLGAGSRLASVEALAYAAGGRTVRSHALADYTDAQLSATNRLLGGTVGVESLRPDGTRRARADLSFESSERDGGSDGDGATR